MERRPAASTRRLTTFTSRPTPAEYDNEWGFTHQMLREALSMLRIDRQI
jgi:hypothetical protein